MLSAFLPLLACFFLSFCTAQNIAAFYSTKGPTIISLDTTGNFLYNVYAQQGFSSMRLFAPTVPPKNGTSVACVGYSSSTSVYGAIFYQTPNNSIAQQFFKCSYASGNCVNYGGYLISTNVTVPVRSGTGLSASLISADLGYRVSYEDDHGAVRQLAYSNTTQGYVTPWADGFLTTNLTSVNGSALSTTYIPSLNATTPAQQTVYQLANNQILGMFNNRTTAINETQIWSAVPPITNLPNWYSSNATFSTVIYGDWLMLFYVDMTRQLQFLRSTDGGQTWQVQPPQALSVWPLADTPNAPVAAATSVNASDNSASVFYISNGHFVRSIITDYNWLPYIVVQPVVISNTTTNSTAPFRPSVKDTKDIKIGASIGSISAFLIIVVVAWFLSRKKQPEDIERPESIGEWRESSSEYSGKPELDGHPAEKFELDHDPECLLLHQLQLVRMHELKGEIPVELQNTEAPRPELDHTLCKCELDASVLCELPTSLEKEEGMSIAESSGKGKEKEVIVSMKEVPSWNWANLRRQVHEKDEEMGGRTKAVENTAESKEES